MKMILNFGNKLLNVCWIKICLVLSLLIPKKKPLRMLKYSRIGVQKFLQERKKISGEAICLLSNLKWLINFIIIIIIEHYFKEESIKRMIRKKCILFVSIF